MEQQSNLFVRNYWYSARDREIFLDLDSNRATARAMSVLRLAIRQKRLPVSSVWLYSTPTPHHAHMIIRLKSTLGFISKLAWSLWLGNDRLRAAYVLYRFDEDMEHCDLLVTQTPYGFRPHDAECFCKGKHKAKDVTDACPAMEMLLKDRRSADYFARTGKAPTRKKIRVPWGRVKLSQIRDWKEP